MSTELSGTRVNGWRLFLTTHAAVVARIERDLAAAGVISLQWYDVLVELAQAPERRLRMYELAEAVVLSK
ncbi:MAG: MarR family winged helix-turn-helix transcriptional regulator, partial [Chloroflexota bacterium]